MGAEGHAESGARWTAGPWGARPTWRAPLGTRSRRFLLLPASAGSPSALTEAPLRRSSVGGPAPARLGAASASATRLLVSARAGQGCSASRAPAPRPSQRRSRSHLGPRLSASSATPPSPLAAPPPQRPSCPGVGRPVGGVGGAGGEEAGSSAPPAAPQEVRPEPSAAVLLTSNLVSERPALWRLRCVPRANV